MKKLLALTRRQRLDATTFLCFSLLAFAPSALSAQPHPSKVDSLEQALKTATDAQAKFSLYHQLVEEARMSARGKAHRYADLYWKEATASGDDFERARASLDKSTMSDDSTTFFAEKTLQLAAARLGEQRFQYLAMRANLNLGDEHRFIGQNDRALGFLRTALQQSSTELDSILILTSMGQVFTQQGKKDEALTHFTQVRDYALRTGHTFLRAKSLKYIGDIYADMGKGKAAVDCFQQSVATYASMQDTIGQLGGLASIGWLYVKQDSSVQLAIQHFEELIEKAEAIGHEGFITWAMLGLTQCYMNLGDQAKAFDFALRTYERAKDIPDDVSMKWQVLAQLSNAYNQRREFDKALQYATQALNGYENGNEEPGQELLPILMELTRAQMGSGNTEAAWQTLQRHQQLSEQLNLAKINEEIASAEARFRVRESEFALDESKRANRLQSEKAAAQRTLYLSLLAGAGLFLVLGFFAYRRMQRDKSLIFSQKVQLEQSLGEKETLLKEIHHRVKNNLQIISGLLEKQARKTSDVEAKKLMKEGQDRVFSMALVHQNLYQSDNLSAIEIRSYLEALSRNIQASQASPDQKIEVQLEVDDSTLDIDTAIPVALILNELMTNCFKYAFVGRAAGLVRVDFQRRANEFFLRVRDNGIGLSPDFDLRRSKSLGLNLVRGLVRQLDGKLDMASSAEGAVFEVQFAKA